VIPLVPGKKMYRYPNHPENPNTPPYRSPSAGFPVATGTLRGRTILLPKKPGPIKSPFFPFSILQAKKVEICHPEGSVRDIFQAYKKANFP
jgi:hypothetical protein